jgi:hypothetical protein
MSTLMLDTRATERLTRQYETVIRRSNPRDAELETRRFVSYLCDRLERNNHALMAAVRNRRPDHLFTASLASRQGESILLTCMFLMNDLAVRVGRPRLADYLMSTQTKAGRALARRIGARPHTDLRLPGVRFSPLEAGFGSRHCAATEAPFAGTNTVSADYRFRGAYPGSLRVGIVVENEGYRTCHFAAVQVRLYARFDSSDEWTQTQGDGFGFLERVAPSEAQMLALRGFDCMDLLRGTDRANRDPVAIRILARLI